MVVLSGKTIRPLAFLGALYLVKVLTSFRGHL